MKLALVALLLVACHPPARVVDDPNALPPPSPVVPSTSEDALACARLDRLGCPEAHPRLGTCTDTLSQARTEHVAVPSACVATAADVIAVRHCGSVSTLTFECLGR